MLLGQHATRLTETTRDVEVISSQVGELSNQVRELMWDQDSLRTAAAAPASAPVLAWVAPEPKECQLRRFMVGILGLVARSCPGVPSRLP